jgi:hypothetical protein
MSLETETEGRRTSTVRTDGASQTGRTARGITEPLFWIWTAAWMIEGARLVPETRGAGGPLVGAAMGFAVAMFPALLLSLARTGRGAFAARIVALGIGGTLLMAALWLAFPATRMGWQPW